MASIVNLASFAGADNALITASDAGWVSHPLYSGTAKVLSGRALQSGTTTALYYRSEVPASANQKVTATLYAANPVTNIIVNLVARVSTSQNTFFLAQFLPVDRVKLFKFVNGTATQLGTDALVTSQSAGSSFALELEVTGVSPSISVVVRFAGAAVITQTVNETALDAAGRVGLRFGTSSATADATNGTHITAFSATDEGGVADTTAPTLSSPTATPGSTTASGTVSTDEANGTLYYLATANASETLATVKAGSSQAVSVSGAQSVVATGLTASAAYYLHYAHTDSAANDSAVVSSAQFTTNSGADATPPTLTGSITASAITQTSYTLAWPTGADNTAVTAYEYSLNAGAYVGNGTATTVNITGRTAGATDAVTVRAKDAAGNVSTPVLSASVTLLASSLYGITTPTLKNNTGTVLANETGVVVNVYNASTGVLVLNKTGLTSSALGIVTFTDAALVNGTSYAYEVILSGGRRRLPLVVAA